VELKELCHVTISPGVRNYPNHQKFHSKGWAFEE
jgi:hypothetical protein